MEYPHIYHNPHITPDSCKDDPSHHYPPPNSNAGSPICLAGTLATGIGLNANFARNCQSAVIVAPFIFFLVIGLWSFFSIG